MLATHNAYRSAIGAPVVAGDAQLDAAARNHANYLILNRSGGHFEQVGNPGFTGYAPQDRASAAGFRGYTVSEVVTRLGDGVRVLWNAPYHRLGMMHPQAVAVGWSGMSRTVGDIAYDFGRPAPDVLRSPAAGQTGVPTSWSGDEYPAPQPADAAGPFGYPIMLVYSHGRRVDLRGAQLSTPDGRPLAFYVAPQEYETDYQVLVPRDPLPPATRIHVRMDLTVSGEDLTNEWDFTTVALPARSTGTIVGPRQVVVHARPGATAQVTVTYRNPGPLAWGQAPEDAPIYTGFAQLSVDSTRYAQLGLPVGWADSVTPARISATVPAGATTTVTFSLKAPSTVGTYDLPIRLMGYEHGGAVLGEPNCNCAFPFYLDDGPTVVSLVSDLGYHSAWSAQSPYPTLLPNEVSTALFLQFRNTGDLPWLRGVANKQANLGVVGDDGSWSALGVGWPTANRVAVQTEAQVDPGATGTFSFRLRAPPTPGRYRIAVRPVIDGTTWMEDQGAYLEVTVAEPSFHSRWLGQSPYPTVAVGGTTTISLTFRNVGATTWVRGATSEARLGVNLDDHMVANIGMAVGWPTPDRPAIQTEGNVAPGQVATFTFQLKGVQPGMFTLHLRPVVDGIAWMEDEGVFMTVTVR